MKRRNFTRMIWICWCLIRYTFKINWTFLHCLTSSPFICVWVCGQIHAHESVSMYLNTSMVRPEENTKCLLSLHFGTISFTALPPRNKDFYWTRSWFLGVGPPSWWAVGIHAFPYPWLGLQKHRHFCLYMWVVGICPTTSWLQRKHHSH